MRLVQGSGVLGSSTPPSIPQVTQILVFAGSHKYKYSPGHTKVLLLSGQTASYRPCLGGKTDTVGRTPSPQFEKGPTFTSVVVDQRAPMWGRVCVGRGLSLSPCWHSSHSLSLQEYLAHNKRHPLGTYRRPLPRVLGWSDGRFLMSEVPL